MRYTIFLIILVSVLFLRFQPRLNNYFYTSSRSATLSSLLEKVAADGHLDSQFFWETREFYYPGVFYVYEDGLKESNIINFQNHSNLKLFSQNTFPILVYDSSKWKSYESLVSNNDLSQLVTLPSVDPIYSDSQTKIYKTNGTTYIYFIKPFSELKVTNGFIYTKDEILKKYQYWFGVSVITE